MAQIYNLDGKLLAASATVEDDSTKQILNFEDFQISSLNGKAVRIKFLLNCGELYSFWFSNSTNGDSGGYLGAGAPKDK